MVGMMYSMRCLIIKNLCCLSFIFLFLGFIHFLLTSFLPSFLPDHYHFLPSLLTYFLPCSYLPSFRGFLSFLFPFFIFLLPSFLPSFLSPFMSSVTFSYGRLSLSCFFHHFCLSIVKNIPPLHAS